MYGGGKPLLVYISYLVQHTHVFNYLTHHYLSAIECQELTLENGNVSYTEDTSNPFSVGTMATLTCNVGYFLVGDRIRHCTKNDQIDTARGEWNENKSYCQGK